MPADKSAHLAAEIDLDRPELADVEAAADPAAAFVDHVREMPRSRYVFEWERKREMLAFLHEHYAAWRDFDTTPAEHFVDLPLEEASRNRGLMRVGALGKAWWATGDPAWGRAFQRFYLETDSGGMFSWGSFNGSQPVHELPAWFLLQDCPGLTTEGRIAYLDHLITITHEAWDQHTSQWQQIGLGPEGHNWYLHGMHCLPHVGLLFPEFKRSAFFLRTGWSVVEEHVRGHLKADGGARETTLGYQAGSMGCLWDMYLIAHRNGWPMSSGMSDRLLRATLFLLRLAGPDGSIPSFGDSRSIPGALTGLAAVAAAVTGDGRCKWYAERFRVHQPDVKPETPGQIPESAFWQTGLAGAACYATTCERDPNHTSVLWAPTGYAAMRDGDAPDAAYLAIAAADRGPIVTSHGHNDIFAIDVHALGRRFLGEMGCAPYGTSDARNYDQLTEAHNTLSIAGMEQVPIVDEWRWEHHLKPAIRRWISEPTHDYFHGTHEGFYRYPKHKTLHARKILFIKSTPTVSAYWVVIDWIDTDIDNDCLIHFHGAVPGSAEGRTITFNDGDARLVIAPPEADDVRLSLDDSDGLKAYRESKSLDAKDYPHFVYRQTVSNHSFAWVLMPLGPGDAAPRVRRRPMQIDGEPQTAWGATALTIEGNGFSDTLCVSHRDFDGALGEGGQEGWGWFRLERQEGGKVTLSITHTMADGCAGV